MQMQGVSKNENYMRVNICKSKICNQDLLILFFLIQEKSVSRYGNATEIECIHNHCNPKDCELFLGVTGTFYEFQKV